MGSLLLSGLDLNSFSLVQFSCSVVSDSFRPHELQHVRPPCPSPTPRVHPNPNPCPSSWWCHPTISSSVVPFSSCPQSFPASGSFPVSQLFASGGQNIGASALASVLPMSIQGWFLLELTGLVSLMSKGLSRVFFSTTIWKNQFFRKDFKFFLQTRTKSSSRTHFPLSVNPRHSGCSFFQAAAFSSEETIPSLRL